MSIVEPGPIRSPLGGSAHFLSGLPELPDHIVLPDKQKVDVRGTCWEARDLSYGTVKFDFGSLANLDAGLLHRVRLTLVHVLENYSVSHARNLFNTFVEFNRAVLKTTGTTSEVILSNLLNYRARLRPETEWKLGVVRILLETSEELGYGFCATDALGWLDSAVIRGNPKGRDVRTRDPKYGPFTAAEIQTLNSALNAAYGRGAVHITDYAAGQVLLAFGMRPRQLVALKERDLLIASGRAGERLYTLMVPQAKRRGEVLRTSFKARACDRRLGLLLEELLEANAAKKDDPAIDPDQWPMFIGPHPGENPPGLEYHIPAVEMRTGLSSLLEGLTGLQANSKRFRDTVAQNMADEGASKYGIAEALGHADTQQVDKYLEVRPELVARLNHLAVDFTPILQAFAGVLIAPDEAGARLAPRSRHLHERGLPDRGNDPLGHCGQHGFCGLAKPIGCYTCISLRPWDDGPPPADA